MKIEANIISSTESFYGEISFDKNITSVKKISEIDLEKDYIIPGFIDLHVHGGAGHDFMDGNQGIRKILQEHFKNGTTALLLTTVTYEQDKLKQLFNGFKTIIDNPQENESKILGIHLEGPYISEEKIGAQPHFARTFSLSEVLELHQITPLKIITVSVESGITNANIEELNKLGIKVQFGHSNCSYEEAKSFFDINENLSITHLFNAMSSFHHRKPGLVGASLAHANYAEIIPDLIHVHSGAIRTALRAIPNTYFVTDATSATGMPDGDYTLGGQAVHKCSNGVRLKDGTLAGSSLTMHQALKNSLELGLNLSESIKRLSTIQSKILEMNNIGDIKENYISDLVLLDSNFEIKKVFKNGF